MSAKTKSRYVCKNCQKDHPKWVGRCDACKEWGSVEEVTASASAAASGKSAGLKSSLTAVSPLSKARSLRDIDARGTRHIPTGIGELDRVLGGGVVPGGVVLLAGEPGAGKSTLLIELCEKIAQTGKTVLYASGEENEEQIKLRAERCGVSHDDIFLASTQELSEILGHIEEVDPDFLIVDSVQTVASSDVNGSLGGITQVMEVANVLTKVAKSRAMSTFLVGQMNKSDEIASSRKLTHLVDVVLALMGDKQSTLRFLRGEKNRYGAAEETGYFVHTSNGLEEVPDPSGLFLGDRDTPSAGTCVTVVMDGKRPIMAEVQALVAPSYMPHPKREVSGLDKARLAMTQAGVEQHGGVRLKEKDVFVATVGGIRIVEPCADLAIALAMASARSGEAVPHDTLAIGEVTLAGGVRPIYDVERRLSEAGRMGFKTAVVPKGTLAQLNGGKPATGPSMVNGVVLVEVTSLRDAITRLGLTVNRSSEG